MQKCQRVNISLAESLILTSTAPSKISSVSSAASSLENAAAAAASASDLEKDERLRRERQRVKRSRTIHTISGGGANAAAKVTTSNVAAGAAFAAVSPRRIRSSSSMGAIASLGRFQTKVTKQCQCHNEAFTSLPRNFKNCN